MSKFRPPEHSINELSELIWLLFIHSPITCDFLVDLVRDGYLFCNWVGYLLTFNLLVFLQLNLFWNILESFDFNTFRLKWLSILDLRSLAWGPDIGAIRWFTTNTLETEFGPVTSTRFTSWWYLCRWLLVRFEWTYASSTRIVWVILYIKLIDTLIDVNIQALFYLQSAFLESWTSLWGPIYTQIIIILRR